MEGNGSRQDQFIGLCRQGIDIDIITKARTAHAGQGTGIMAVMLDDVQAAHHIAAADYFIFLFRVSPVGSLGNEDRDLMVLYANTVQFLHQYGQHAVRMNQPGYITDDDADHIGRLYDIIQRLAVNGMTQGLPYSLFFVLNGFRMRAMQII